MNGVVEDGVEVAHALIRATEHKLVQLLCLEVHLGSLESLERRLSLRTTWGLGGDLLTLFCDSTTDGFEVVEANAVKLGKRKHKDMKVFVDEILTLNHLEDRL